jgi:hypothetical protein
MIFFTPSILRASLLVALCALLTACGAIKLTYNNADSLIYWWLDGYVDFTVDQKVHVKNEMQAFHQWHRKTQLPAFADIAHSLQKMSASDVTAAQLCTFADKIQERLLPPLSAHIEPQVLWLVTHLTPAQIKSIEEKYAKTNEKWLDEWQPKTKATLIKNTEKSILERTDSLYGSLDDEQRKWLRETIRTSPFDAKTAYAERLRRQQDLLDVLKDIQAKKLSSDAAKEPMRAVLQRSLVSPNPANKAYAEKMREYNCDLYAKLHNKTNPEQRKHALSKLIDYERDFKILQATK